MCGVNRSPSSSTTSSRRGQIISPEPAAWPTRSPPPPDGDTGEEFVDRRAKRSRDESGVRAGGGTGDEGAGDGRDRISELPDAILLSILSYLPLRDAARTTVLSPRWRRLFDQSLLDFNACQPFPPEEGRGCEWVIRAIDSILAAPRRVRVRSFRFVMYGQGFAGREGVIAGWFRTLAHRGVQEVDIDMLYTVPKPLLPSSLLMFDSLKTLRVCCCNFPDAARGLRLPALSVLDLSNVGMSQNSLEAMLSDCPSLECAKLKSITGIDKICLRSKSLMRLFGDFGNLQELVVEDAPNLEELVGIGLPSGKAKVKIVIAPKLQVLGYLGISVRPLVLHDTIFDGGIVQARTLMCGVKSLAIQVPFPEKGYTIFVTQLLKCFPCIESLHVQPDIRSLSRGDEVEKWDFDTSIQCIEHCINKLVFEDFEGEEWQCEFLYFLLRMTRALKFVEFYSSQSKDWANDQMEMIGHKNRASPDVQFRFFISSKPKQVSNLYLCHCCPRRCNKENKVSLLYVGS